MQKSLLAAIAAVVLLTGYTGITAIDRHDKSEQTDLDLSTILAEADAAAVDYFMKISGVDGESTEPGHMKEIEVLSFHWGASQMGSMGSSAAGGGGGAGKVSMQDFHFTMKYNKASPKLFLACATGEHFSEALITVRKAGGDKQEYLKIKLTDIRVSSYSSQGIGSTQSTDVMGLASDAIPATDTIPTDQVSFSFAKIEIEYSPTLENGQLGAPIKAGYDLKLNKKV